MANKILFVNACVREQSRTLALAEYFLGMLNGEIHEINLNEVKISPLTRESLAARKELLKKRKYDDPTLRFAWDFAAADTIVIAAPYWDFSFPALLKIYLEAVSVSGITYRYSNGLPRGLCRAKRLVYITAAGGIVDFDFGYNYIHTLAKDFFGIPEAVCFRAEDLDFGDVSEEVILNEVKAKMGRYLLKAYDLKLNMMKQ